MQELANLASAAAILLGLVLFVVFMISQTMLPPSGDD